MGFGKKIVCVKLIWVNEYNYAIEKVAYPQRELLLMLLKDWNIRCVLVALRTSKRLHVQQEAAIRYPAHGTSLSAHFQFSIHICVMCAPFMHHRAYSLQSRRTATRRPSSSLATTLITFRNSCQLFTYRIRVFATWSTRNARRRSRSERENPSTFVPWSVVLHICSALCMKITFNFKYPKVPSIHYSPFVISKIMKRRNLLLKVQRHAAGCRFCSQQSSLVADRFWQSVLCC